MLDWKTCDGEERASGKKNWGGEQRKIESLLKWKKKRLRDSYTVSSIPRVTL